MVFDWIYTTCNTTTSACVTAHCSGPSRTNTPAQHPRLTSCIRQLGIFDRPADYRPKRRRRWKRQQLRMDIKRTLRLDAS